MAELARRLGAEHPAFVMDEWSLIDATLKASGLPGADEAHAARWIDCALSFERMHFLEGFGKRRFRFAPDWAGLGADHAGLPELPDHCPVTDEVDAVHPFRLITPPSRHFLNTSFTETPSSRQLAGRPTALIHAEDCRALGLWGGDMVRLGNERGSVVVHVAPTDGIARQVVAVEGIWPDDCFVEGVGINLLTSAEPALPAGGAVFHDTKVWVERV
ncbi:MAG: molybdopterin dinucleotide binding domain-containing protein, partial [Actinomycetota bacterium]